jgi:hypothetical protein
MRYGETHEENSIAQGNPESFEDAGKTHINQSEFFSTDKLVFV